jgi:hypothetical protein
MKLEQLKKTMSSSSATPAPSSSPSSSPVTTVFAQVDDIQKEFLV